VEPTDAAFPLLAGGDSNRRRGRPGCAARTASQYASAWWHRRGTLRSLARTFAIPAGACRSNDKPWPAPERRLFEPWTWARTASGCGAVLPWPALAVPACPSKSDPDEAEAPDH